MIFVSSNGFDVVGAKRFGFKVALEIPARRWSGLTRGAGIARADVPTAAGPLRMPRSYLQDKKSFRPMTDLLNLV